VTDHFELAGRCMPWNDVSKWKAGEWYPMPVGFMERDQEEYIINGYMLYEQDERDPQDLMPVGGMDGLFTFSTALKICEEHNGRRMIK